MRIRQLGRTGIEVSEIGLGGWQLGRSSQWPEGPDEAEAVRLVHEALDAGVTFIDTAPGYADGRSEENIGTALRGRRRDDVVLCTKVGHLPDGSSDWSAESVRASVRRSAERLGTDHLDVVVLHSPPPEVLDGTRGELYGVLDDLRQEGLLRVYGASVDWGDDVDTVLRTSSSRALEVRMSALFQEPWASIGRARDAGAGTIVKVPLESGWLSGRYTADSVFSGVRERWTREQVAERAALVEEVRALLPAGLPLAHGALRFLLAHDGVSTVIPGARTIDHLRDSVAAAAEPLPADVVAAIRDFHERRLADAPLDW
ncbi:aldo/keto reductase [Nocardioides sp. GCM10027113]|uniref:aldo/keto reductase n=1 Tax=unclassified Nocardioides TaxID=2615069 RepID=UPI0036221FF2